MVNQSRGTLPRKKIMIVDDHVLFREGLSSLIHSTSDFDVVGTAGGVFDAIQRAQEVQPDIILMDYAMPDGTGIDATRVILSDLPECKIIFLTMYESDDKLFEALRVGAKGFLPKNTPSPDLTASLRALSQGEIALSRKLVSRVVEEFSRTHKPEPDAKVISRLSVRELDVLRELGNGASNQEIARRLFVSENTVKHHIRSILEKLHVSNRREAGRIATSQARSGDKPVL